MTKQAAIEIVKGYAPHYPTVTAFFVTSDGQVFFEKHMADSHERSLKANDMQEVHVSDLLEGDFVSYEGNLEQDDDQDDETGETGVTGVTIETTATEAPVVPETTAPNKATTYSKTADETAPVKPAKKNSAK